MPRKGGDDENSWLVMAPLLTEMQQIAEGMRGDDLFGDRNFLAVNLDEANAKVRPIVRHPCIGQQLHRRCCPPDKGTVFDNWPWLNEHAAKKFGCKSNRGEYVTV